MVHHITVKTLSGVTFPLELGVNDDIESLKNKVFEVDTSLPVELMRPVWYGKELTGSVSSWRDMQEGAVVIILPNLEDPNAAEVELDLVCVVDCTGSMGAYIVEAQKQIRNIIENIISSERASVTFALVKYRDMSDSYVTEVSPFTDDINEMHKYVNTMSPAGGGDAPEAVASGLAKTLNFQYRDTATKVCVLIADAPPHGLESSGDSHPNGDPGVMDLLQICREIKKQGVKFYSVGCEPSISNYPMGCSWMRWVAEYTGGRYISLGESRSLADVIVGGCREQLNRYKFRKAVLDEITKLKGFSGKLTEEHCDIIAERLNSKSFKLISVCFNDTSNPKVFIYTHFFDQAKNLAEAKAMRVANPNPTPPAAPPSAASTIGKIVSFVSAVFTDTKDGGEVKDKAEAKGKNGEIALLPVTPESVREIYEAE